MTARVSSRRRWSLRDVPRTYVLFVWLAYGFAVFIYANEPAPKRLVSAPATGSSIEAATSWRRISHRLYHHRSGERRKLLAAHDRQSHRKNVGQGYVNCYEAVPPAG
jgi:hypothetical protein